MTPDGLFAAGNSAALAGWLALAAAPLAPRLAILFAGTVVPLLLATAYSGLVLAFWWGADGGFGTLAEVMQLFTRPEIALAGWLHYLAFDLLVGSWEVRTARREGIPHALALPCLALTFLFGPAGFLAFQGLRLARGRHPMLASEMPS